MSMTTNTNTAAKINEQINNPDLAAAYKRIVVSDSTGKKGTYDLSIEFLRKHGGSPWRNAKLVEGLTAEQAAVAACVLRKYCVEEMRVVDVKDHLPNPDAKKEEGKAKKKTKKPAVKAKNYAAGIVAVK